MIYQSNISYSTGCKNYDLLKLRQDMKNDKYNVHHHCQQSNALWFVLVKWMASTLEYITISKIAHYRTGGLSYRQHLQAAGFLINRLIKLGAGGGEGWGACYANHGTRKRLSMCMIENQKIEILKKKHGSRQAGWGGERILENFAKKKKRQV